MPKPKPSSPGAVLLSQADAAARLGLSSRSFSDSVAPALRVVAITSPRRKRPILRWHVAELDKFIAISTRDSLELDETAYGRELHRRMRTEPFGYDAPLRTDGEGAGK